MEMTCKELSEQPILMCERGEMGEVFGSKGTILCLVEREKKRWALQASRGRNERAGWPERKRRQTPCEGRKAGRLSTFKGGNRGKNVTRKGGRGDQVPHHEKDGREGAGRVLAG